MKKGLLIALPAVLLCPLMLLVLGMGNASLEAVRATCTTTANTSTSGSFGIGTLNWRGASHYSKNPHPGERPYDKRMPHMVAKIAASGASIIGFQEFEPPQADAFLDATDGAWAIVAGKRRGMSSTADAIAYQPGAWTVDEIRYVSIRYGGPIIEVPLVRFTSRSDEGAIWVLNTHHPADSIGGTDAMRDAAVRTESRSLQELQLADPRTPLLLTGDMNDRARFKQLFLALADGWSSANPSDEQVDWIMGSATVRFSGTVVDHSTNDHAHRYTDHPFVHTTAQAVAPTPLANATDSGLVSQAEVAASAAHQAGFRGTDLVTAVAIARVESSWDPRARNGTHFGLWQIAISHRGQVPGWDKPDDIYDPLLNARYAFALYSARVGAAEAKFADWIPFQTTDHRQYLAVARQAVAAVSGDTTNAADTGCTTSPMTAVLQLSAELRSRIDAMTKTPNGLCGLSWTSGAPCTYKNQCPKVVDALYGGPGVGRGYGNGQDVAQGIIDAGLADSHGTGLDPLPPVGSVLSYATGNGVGHVAIYVGAGKIFGNDYGCTANGVHGCVGFANVEAPSGSVTWALPRAAFDLGGMPAAAT